MHSVIHVCMHAVCVCGCLDEWVGGWLCEGALGGRMGGGVGVCLLVWHVHVCMHAML